VLPHDHLINGRDEVLYVPEGELPWHMPKGEVEAKQGLI